MWELFNLGKQPYSGKSIQKVIEMVKMGGSLNCDEIAFEEM